MNFLKKLRADGISLRTVHMCLIILAVIVSGLLCYARKDLIRADMRDSLQALERLTHETQSASSVDLKRELRLVRVIIKR